MREDRKKGMDTARIAVCLLMLTALVSACKSDDEETLPDEPLAREFPGVDERLWPFFIRFEDEAAERGVIIDLAEEGITGVIVPIDEDNVAGTCNFNRNVPNHVMVDEDFFNRANVVFREFVVFHELGHCTLFRDHLETEDANGICTSIMRSGVEGCRDNYSFITRDSYLDELYDDQFRGDIFRNQTN